MKSYKAKSYQKEGTTFIIDKKCCGIFADPGLGKTAITLSAIKALKMAGIVNKVLIVAPLLVIQNTWPDEIKKWHSFCDLRYTDLNESVSNLKLNKTIYLINPESLIKLLSMSPAVFKKYGFDMLVIDESSKFKSPKAKRFKHLKKYLTCFEYRVILSGTPAPNSLQDLFSQAYIIDLGATFGKKITHFRNFYFELVNPKFFKYQIKDWAIDAIHKKMSQISIRFDSKDHIDLPPLLYNYINVQLPTKAYTIYNDIEKELFAIVEGEEVLALSGASVYKMCHQIANGRLYKPEKGLAHRLPRPDSRGVYRLHSVKIKAVEDLADELQGKPLLIAYLYNHDLAALREAFPKAPVIGKGTPKEESQKIIRKWNKRKIPILLCQPQSMAHGLNMQNGGNDICFYSLTDNLENYQQLIRRLYGRQGTKKPAPVRVHHIIAKNTIDLAIKANLQRKGNQQSDLLNAIKEYAKWKAPF